MSVVQRGKRDIVRVGSQKLTEKSVSRTRNKHWCHELMRIMLLERAKYSQMMCMATIALPAVELNLKEMFFEDL